MGEDKQRAALAAGRKKRSERNAVARAARDAGQPTRYSLFKAGKLPVTEWDDAEISKGALRDLGGGWNGIHTQRFTQKEAADIRRELLRRGQRMLEEAYFAALGSLAEIAVVAEKDSDRTKAATIILERVAGKVPDKVEVGAADAFSDVLSNIIDEAVKDDEPA